MTTRIQRTAAVIPVVVALAFTVRAVATLQVGPQAAPPQFRTPVWLEMDLPITAPRLEAAFATIAEQSRMPLGVELMSGGLPSRSSGVFTLRLGGLSWTELSELLSQYGAAYDVREMGTVTVVRPHGAWDDTGNLLNRRINEFAVDSVRADEALFAVLAAADHSLRPPSKPPSPTALRDRMPDRFRQIEGELGKRIRVRLENASVLDALNSIITEHGNIWWRVRREVRTTAVETTAVELRGFSGWGITIEIGWPPAKF